MQGIDLPEEFKDVQDKIKPNTVTVIRKLSAVEEIGILRSKFYLHRGDAFLVSLSDIDKCVSTECQNRPNILFSKVKAFLTHVVKNLKFEEKEIELIGKPDFLHTTNLLSVPSVQRDQTKQNLTKKFQGYMHEAYNSKFEREKAEELLFDFTVNIIPLLKHFYSASSKKKLILELEKLRKLRNELIHNFHGQGDSERRKIYMIDNLRDLRVIFSKFCCFQESICIKEEIRR